MFFSPPFSCSASLCEQLLAGGSGETPAYSLLGILTYYFFLLLTPPRLRIPQGLEDCRIITSFYYRNHNRGHQPDWNTAVLLLPFTVSAIEQDWKTAVFILPSTSAFRNVGYLGLEDCRITTSFYFESKHLAAKLDWKTAVFILPSTPSCVRVVLDWKTAVLLLPSTEVCR